MLPLKYALYSAGIAMFVAAVAILSCDVYRFIAWRHGLRPNLSPDLKKEPPLSPPADRWLTALALVMLAWAPVLLSIGFVIIPHALSPVRQTLNHPSSNQQSVDTQ